MRTPEAESERRRSLWVRSRPVSTETDVDSTALRSSPSPSAGMGCSGTDVMLGMAIREDVVDPDPAEQLCCSDDDPLVTWSDNFQAWKPQSLFWREKRPLERGGSAMGMSTMASLAEMSCWMRSFSSSLLSILVSAEMERLSSGGMRGASLAG